MEWGRQQQQQQQQQHSCEDLGMAHQALGNSRKTSQGLECLPALSAPAAETVIGSRSSRCSLAPPPQRHRQDGWRVGQLVASGLLVHCCFRLFVADGNCRRLSVLAPAIPLKGVLAFPSPLARDLGLSPSAGLCSWGSGCTVSQQLQSLALLMRSHLLWSPGSSYVDSPSAHCHFLVLMGVGLTACCSRFPSVNGLLYVGGDWKKQWLWGDVCCADLLCSQKGILTPLGTCSNCGGRGDSCVST